MTNRNSNPVYSTDSGRICPDCWMPVADCICKTKSGAPKSDGVVRVRREIKGRNGKPATLISGVPLSTGEIENLASELKRRCACGGSVKDGEILIQGDRVKQVMELLKEKGFTVKQSGG